MWNLLVTYEHESQVVDLDYLSHELQDLKANLGKCGSVSSINQGALETHSANAIRCKLNEESPGCNDCFGDSQPASSSDCRSQEDLLRESLGIALKELSQKDGTLKQVLQVFEFVLAKYKALGEEFKEASEELRRAQDAAEYKAGLVESLNVKLERAVENLDELELQNARYEEEIEKLKRQVQAREPGKEVIKSINAMEQRVRKQSELDSYDKICGLEVAIDSLKADKCQLELRLTSKTEKVRKLKRELCELSVVQEEYDLLKSEMNRVVRMKSQLEAQMTSVLEEKEGEIDFLKK